MKSLPLEITAVNHTGSERCFSGLTFTSPMKIREFIEEFLKEADPIGFC